MNAVTLHHDVFSLQCTNSKSKSNDKRPITFILARNYFDFYARG